MELKQFTKNIKVIANMGKKADTLIHDSAMFALEQVNVYSNSTPAKQLISALSASMRKEALFVWFLDFGMVRRNTKDNTLEFAGKKELKIDGEVISGTDILPYADDQPFYLYTKEIAPASVYDVQKAILSIVKRASKFNKDGKTVEHAELLAKLSKMIPVKEAA